MGFTNLMEMGDVISEISHGLIYKLTSYCYKQLRICLGVFFVFEVE